jgi:predicted  nucleic acid-binding Zn-ribbon protein
MLASRGSSRVVFSAVLVSAAVVGTGAARADDEPLRAAVASLFDLSWQKSADGLAKAEQQHRKAKEIAPIDRRADYALALVQWRYLRFSDAEKTLVDLTTADPEDWDAARARIYLAVLMKKYSQALVDIDQLSRRVAAAEGDAKRDESRRDISQFLGRLFGYLEGPAQKLVSQTSVTDVRKAVMARLGASDLEAFSESFGALGERFTTLDEEKRRLQVETKESEAKQKEDELKRLAAERDSVDSEKEAIRRQADEARATAEEAVWRIDQQMIPLEAELARLNNRGNIVRGEINRLGITADGLLAEADATDDPALAASLRTQAGFLIGRRRGFEIEYQQLDAQAVQVNAQRAALFNQRARIVAQYEATARQLGVAVQKLGKVERRITSEESKNRKPATGLSGQVQSLASSAASITSYLEFPLDRERQRILDSFGK